MSTPFARRRRHLMDAYGTGSILVIPGAHMVSRNSDVEHDFRQDSDFWFLTGFDEPDSVLVLAPGREGEETVMFVRPRDRDAETWTGRRAGVEGAVADYGADKAFLVDAFEVELARLCENAKQFCFTLGRDPDLDQKVIRAARRHRLQPRLGLDGPDHWSDPAVVLGEMRLHKDDEALADMRRAASITAHAHNEAMRLSAAGLGERELQAAIEYVFKAAGADRVGYSSIVAAGANATILHYNTNRMQIGAQDLVLIDAGAEYRYQSADITRTFPASGRFTPAQRLVYEVVLHAQKEAIDACRTDKSVQDVHDLTVRLLTEGMVRIGLLQGEVAALIADNSFRRYYMHRTSHWLGMDVHDVGTYRAKGEWRPLTPGMVLTIEPGLYVAEDDEKAPVEFRGIGVRIEDDVLVTGGAPEVLTAECVKEIHDIEAMVGSGSRYVSRVVLPGARLD